MLFHFHTVKNGRTDRTGIPPVFHRSSSPSGPLPKNQRKLFYAGAWVIGPSRAAAPLIILFPHTLRGLGALGTADHVALLRLLLSEMDFLALNQATLGQFDQIFVLPWPGMYA